MRCSFCESTDKERTYVEGANSSTFICSNCIELIYDMVIVKGVKSAEDINNLTQEESGPYMFSELIDKIIDDYKADPRNKVHIDEDTLLAAAAEETGNDVSVNDLRKAIVNFLSGDMNDDDQTTYDGAVYACSVAANNCFGDDPEDEVDYEVDWLENDDGSYTAEVRPC